MFVRAKPVRRADSEAKKSGCSCGGGQCGKCAAKQPMQQAEATIAVTPGRAMDFRQISILPPEKKDDTIIPPTANEFGDTTVDGGPAAPAPGPTPVPAQTPPATATTGPCGCCVDSVTIGNITRIDTAARMGHSFDVTIAMDFPATGSGGGGTTRCTLEWWERTNLPAIPGHPPNTWTDMFALAPNSPTFAPWRNQVADCETSEAVVINDPPSLARRPGRTVNRTLEFDIIVRSQGATCDNAMRNVTATQVLDMVNGNPNWDASSFTTP